MLTVAPDRPRAVALVSWASCTVVVVLVAYILIGAPLDGQPIDAYTLSAASTGLFGALFAAVLLPRAPRHPIGWLFLVLGLSRAVAGAAQVWCVSALMNHPGRLGGLLASWLQLWTPVIGVALAPMIIILFPDGRLPGRIWRVVPALTLVALLLGAVAVPAGAWRFRGAALLPTAPVPDDPVAHLTDAVQGTCLAVVAVAAVVALIGLLRRALRTVGDVRQQIKWFGLGITAALVANVLVQLTDIGWLLVPGIAATFAGIGLGIFRFRLYDVDRVIRRTIVYGVLTLALVTAFAALDVTVAVITGGRSPIAAAVAAFVVALLLRPIRDWVQNIVDRLYDRRAYHELQLVRRLGEQIGREAVGPDRVRDTLRRALHDPTLEIYYAVRHTDGAYLVDGDGVEARIDLGDSAVLPVQRQGQDIAVLVHGPIDPAQLAVVVPAAATALEHSRLQAELSVQLAALRTSRGRIVAAGDAERRRIERDLHDGAQQRLVGLAVHIQSTRRDTSVPSDIDELLTFTVDQLQAGVQEIRALVHAILPPALVTGGLPAALAELRGAAISCHLPDRLDPDIEATAWFVACEGVANARKHAAGSPVTVAVDTGGGRLRVEVVDAGPGGARPDGDGLRQLADRVEAHGGSLTVVSHADTGTRLTAELPCG